MKHLILAFLLAATSFSPAFGETISVLYKRESQSSVPRTDSAAQSAIQAFEEKLIEGGFEVVQADPKIYEILDKSAGVIVTFAPGAGYSLLLDVIKSTRPNPGTELSWADVRLRAKVFSGRRVVANLAGTGQIAFREGAEEKAFEAAARKAAAGMVPNLIGKLQNLAPQEDALASPAIEAVQASPGTPAASAQPAPPLPAPATAWAVLFGVSDFSNVGRLNRLEVPNLDAVKNDIREFRKTLVGFGVPASQIAEMVDKDATTEKLRQSLNGLMQRVKQDDLVVVFLASHGMPKQEGISGFGYPVTYDTVFRDKNSIIDFEEIQNTLKSLPARRVVWVSDTCHSGGASTGLPVVEFSTRGISLKRNVGGVDANIAARVEGKDLAVITSSRADQESADDGNHGVFTSHLLRGFAQTKGKNTIYKIFKDYLEVDVPQAVAKMIPGHKQQPGFSRSGKGDLITF